LPDVVESLAEAKGLQPRYSSFAVPGRNGIDAAWLDELAAAPAFFWLEPRFYRPGDWGDSLRRLALAPLTRDPAEQKLSRFRDALRQLNLKR
jgi:hypothetical protein